MKQLANQFNPWYKEAQIKLKKQFLSFRMLRTTTSKKKHNSTRNSNKSNLSSKHIAMVSILLPSNKTSNLITTKALALSLKAF